MIIGVGVDVVDTARLARSLERAPGLREKLFTPVERDLPLESLAARFAAKEALAKALRTTGDLRWQDVSVPRTPGAAPAFVVTGTVAARAAALGVDAWHLSLSHDAGIATAFVVLEGAPPRPGRQDGAPGVEHGTIA